MPQASDELRDRMKERFGSIDLGGPLDFLEDVGIKDHQYGVLQVPKKLVDADQTIWDCVAFLCDEWDFTWEWTE